MSVATSTAIGIAGGLAAAGGIASSAIGANEQADATSQAVNEQANASANSLAFNQEVYGNTLQNEQPFINLGDQAASTLGSDLANGSLTQAYPGGAFSFSGVNESNDPAYQFDLSQGEQAVQRSAAASGGLVSGGALKDLNNYAQGYASNQYQQSYTNALAAYQQAYNQYETQQANTFNRLSSVAGLGQNAVTQTATSGNSAAGTAANVNTNTANSLSNLYTGLGNAEAGATVAAGNSLTSGVNTWANSLAQGSGSSFSGTQPSSYNGGTPIYSGSNPYTGGYTGSDGNFVVTGGSN